MKTSCTSCGYIYNPEQNDGLCPKCGAFNSPNSNAQSYSLPLPNYLPPQSNISQSSTQTADLHTLYGKPTPNKKSHAHIVALCIGIVLLVVCLASVFIFTNIQKSQFYLTDEISVTAFQQNQKQTIGNSRITVINAAEIPASKLISPLPEGYKLVEVNYNYEANAKQYPVSGKFDCYAMFNNNKSFAYTEGEYNCKGYIPTEKLDCLYSVSAVFNGYLEQEKTSGIFIFLVPQNIDNITFCVEAYDYIKPNYTKCVQNIYELNLDIQKADKEEA